MFDTIIIGMGPSAISCATYLRRFNQEVFVIGGKNSALTSAHLIENYYGIPSISGKDLYEQGIEQLKHLEIPFALEDVLEISFSGHFLLITKDNTYECNKLVLATGKARNKLQVKNAAKYEMRGLSYCATCDGFFYRNKKIGIVGNGDYMLHELSFLKQMTKDITIFSDGLPCENQDYPVVNEKIVSFYGETNLEGIKTTNGEYPLDGVFVAIGGSSTFDFIKHLGIQTDEKGNIVVNSKYQTNIPNLYAIGDAIGGILQVTKASYDGMMAAHEIYNTKK